jgi:hypothetical protein
MAPRDPTNMHNSTNYTPRHRGEQIFNGLRFRLVSTDNIFLYLINASQRAEPIWGGGENGAMGYLDPIQGDETIQTAVLVRYAHHKLCKD